MNKSMLKLIIVLGLVAGTFMMVMPAQAKVAIGTANGWEFSTDGFINAFAVMEDADDSIDGGVAGTTQAGLDLMNPTTNEKSFRVRTGLLPGLIAFNVKAPTTNGIDLAARVGFYPQIQDPDGSRLNNQGTLAGGDATTDPGGADNHTHNVDIPAPGDTNIDFGSHIDLREAFMTADGAFGQILAGRALHLYQGKNILNDMTLFSAGVQGGSSGNTTFGYIGFGYVYTQFGAQFRYTTPDMAGVKLAIGILDPSHMDGWATGGNNYDIVESPGYEAEISYAGSVGGGVNLQAWVNGMSQSAERQDTATSTKEVTCSGIAAGVGVDVAGLHVLASGFSGSGNGSAIMMALDAVDNNDDERDATGLLGQVTYTILGATKIGIQYGTTDIDETNADKLARTTGAAADRVAQVDKRTAYTLGVYHDVTPNWKVMAEYTNAKVEWFDGADRESSTIALGTFFLW